MKLSTIALPLGLIFCALGTFSSENPQDHIPAQVEHGLGNLVSPELVFSDALTEDLARETERLDCAQRVMSLRLQCKERIACELVSGILDLPTSIMRFRDLDAACGNHSVELLQSLRLKKSGTEHYGEQVIARVAYVLRSDACYASLMEARLEKELLRLCPKTKAGLN
jgi:hypothetical protein